jgi:protein phosphatase
MIQTGQVYTCLEQMKNYRIVNGEVLMMNGEREIIHISQVLGTADPCPRACLCIYSSCMDHRALISAASATDVGQIRGHNEDFHLNWEPPTLEEAEEHGWLYIVADGVGGADAGEIASQFASEQVQAYYLAASENRDWPNRLLDAMQTANTNLRQMVAERNDSSRMATTMVALVLHDEVAILANVGDSRAYHWRNGRLEQITRDQTLVAKLVEEGAITAQEAINHPRGNVILYSIGSEKHPKIDAYELALLKGDMFLLCTDGLTKHVSDEEIRETIEQQEPETAVHTLVELANRRGGEDNITVTIVRYGESPYLQSRAVVIQSTAESVGSAGGHITLWFYTLFLAVVMTFLMILLQAWLT